MNVSEKVEKECIKILKFLYFYALQVDNLSPKIIYKFSFL